MPSLSIDARLCYRFRRLGEPIWEISVYMMAYAIPASLVPALFVWTTPALEHVPWLIGLAAVANLG